MAASKEKRWVMKKRFVALVIALLAGHVMMSCDSRHVVERPDTTRPTVVSATPVDNATAVAVTTAVTVAFSEAMDASSINDVSFHMTSATAGIVVGTVTYDAVSNVATLTPSSAMTHDAVYTVTVSAAAKDLAGNTLATPFDWSFRTVPAPGALDAAFGTGGRVRTALGFSDDSVLEAAIQQDGKIVTAGYSSLVTVVTSTIQTKTNHFTIARFQSNGALDTTFGLQQNGRADYFVGTARSVAMQPDGKIVAAGGTDATPASFSDFRVARYNTDGSLDTGFVSDGTSTTNMGYERTAINSLAIQPDGKIVVAGDGINSGSVSYASLIARYDADGTLDGSFNADGKITLTTIGTASRAVVVKIQPDGKIVVGGNFQGVAGPQSIYLARYDSNGLLDPSFSSGIVTASTGTDSVIADFEVLSDGKLIVTGTTNSGNEDLFLMRFNADGTTDGSFGSGGLVITDDINHGVETASGLSVQTDGKIIVAATFRPLSGLVLSEDFALFRYNADGTLDTTFGNGHGMITTDFGSGGNDGASDVQIQTDGKVVVVGPAWSGSDFDIGLARYWP
jgi:uncharacterized delta-60 repeat protein